MDSFWPKINVSSSFRDPSGFIFSRDGLIYRQVNVVYQKNYDYLKNSGLYKCLTEAGLLVAHEEINLGDLASDGVYKIIRPEQVPFISYPYEWCFSQLKHAALIALEIQKKSFGFGMTLKDCSVYNMQFVEGKPILIDTLSFEEYRKGEPWVAYRQFCQHFLAPLALMSNRDIRLNQLLRVYIDGIPLDLTSSLLRFNTRFNFSLAVHIHLHAKAQKYFANKARGSVKNKIARLSFEGLIDSLESAVRRLEWKAEGSEWCDYYKDTDYSAEGLQHKKQIVSDFLNKVNPKIVWDLGANVGMFSRIAADKNIRVVSFDSDPAAVEKNYLSCIEKSEKMILPLVSDLTNPSPGIGWENKESMSLLDRGPASMVFALALVHHLAISDNLPFDKIADFFSKICSSLIIEFVPKDDSQVQRLLSTREDIFSDYTQQLFENEFKRFFEIQDSIMVKGSKRILYLMIKK